VLSNFSGKHMHNMAYTSLLRHDSLNLLNLELKLRSMIDLDVWVYDLYIDYMVAFLKRQEREISEDHVRVILP
jgi:hypothetical protein